MCSGAIRPSGLQTNLVIVSNEFIAFIVEYTELDSAGASVIVHSPKSQGSMDLLCGFERVSRRIQLRFDEA